MNKLKPFLPLLLSLFLAKIAHSQTPCECNDGIDNDGDGLVDWQNDLGCTDSTDCSEGGLPTGTIENGWTVVEPSPDSRIVYVSSSEGNDANDGLTPATAKRTFAGAYSVTRPGFPDWILAKRGDVWTNERLRVKDGRSKAEPAVFATYGNSTERPLLKTGAETGIENTGFSYKHFMVLGYEFIAHTRAYGSPEFVSSVGDNGFRFYSPPGYGNTNIHIEDCKFSWYKNLVIESAEALTNFVFRRNVVTNNYSEDSHGLGFFAYAVDTLVFEENIFDHSGWVIQQQVPGGNSRENGQATLYNHSTYVADSKNVRFKGNIFARSGSIGNKFRSDSQGAGDNIEIIDNLYIDGEVGISIGGNSLDPYRFKNVTISNNVMTDIGKTRPTNRGLAWYLDIQDWDGGLVERNLFLNQANPISNLAYAISFKRGNRDVQIKHNVIHNIYTGLNTGLFEITNEPKENILVDSNIIQNPLYNTRLLTLQNAVSNLPEFSFGTNFFHSSNGLSDGFAIDNAPQNLAGWNTATGSNGVDSLYAFCDPTRKIETYQAHLGETATIEAFAERIVQQSKHHWDENYEATNVNQWIREGFSSPCSSTTPVTHTQIITECEGYSITINGNTYNSTGTYIDTLTASNGVDSILTTELTIIEQVEIINDPIAVTGCEGATINYSVVATGDDLMYQWQMNSGSGFANLSNNVNYSGVNSSQLMVNGLTINMNNHQFRCVVSNSCNSVNSSSAELEVMVAPEITEQPVSITICTGNPAIFSVLATGSELAYQWQADLQDGNGFINLIGATYASLNIQNATPVFNGAQVRCLVSNPCNSVTSAVATFNMISSPAITQQPENAVICSGDATAFTVIATGDNLSYQWELSDGERFNPIPGENGANFVVPVVNSAYNGYEVRCEVSNTCGSVTSSEVIQVVNPITEVMENPQDTTVCEGSAVSFTVTATGDNLTYQWQLDNGSGFANISKGEPYEGVDKATLNITETGSSFNNYSFRCVVVGACGMDISDAATLIVNIEPEGLTTYDVFEEEVCAGISNVTYSVKEIPNSNYNWNYSGEGVTIDGDGHQALLSFSSSATSGSLSVHTQNFCGNGSVLVDNIEVNVSPEVSFELPMDTLCTEADSLLVTGGNSLDGFYYGSGVTNDYFNPAVAGAGSHTIYYHLDGANSCSATDSAVLFVVDCMVSSIWSSNETGISTHGKENSFNLYPNPNKGNQVQISFGKVLQDEVIVRVADIFGRTIQENFVNSNVPGVLLTLDTPLTSGVYTITIIQNGAVRSQEKLLVQ